MAKKNLLVALGLEEADESESSQSSEKEPALTHVGVVINKTAKTVAELARGTDASDATAKSVALLAHIDPTLVPADNGASGAFAVRNNSSFQFRAIRCADMYDLMDTWGIARRKVTRASKNGNSEESNS